MCEFVAGTDDFHAEVFVSADDVARPQSADIEHDLLALQARLVLGDDGIHHRLIAGDNGFALFLDRIVEESGDLAQRFDDLGWTEEVVFQVGNAVLLFHVAADVIHRAIAVQQVELHLRRVHHFSYRAVAGPLGNHAQTHFLKQDAGRPGIAADVVVADD